MRKLVIIDSGNILHKAIFAYSAQYKSELKKIMYSHSSVDENGDDVLGEEIVCEDKARKILDAKIASYEIFMMKPPITYVKMIIGYLKKIEVTLDDKIVICEDYGSWRKDIDKAYKAQRKDFRESKEEASWWTEQYEAMNDLMKTLEKCMNWNFIKIYHMEADDIASCAVRFIDADDKVLVSSDEDWQMLCSLPNVRVFSPYTKKFKEVKNPEKILLKKIKGDISDNLLTVPKTEAEWEKRKMIVDLINLPTHIENIIKPVIETLPLKNLYINKVPFRSCKEELKKLYNLN